MIAAVGGWLWSQRLNKNSETATVAAQERGATVIVLAVPGPESTADDEFLAVGLTQQLIAELMQFFGLEAVFGAVQLAAESDRGPGENGATSPRRLRGQR